jgi:catechol 2,3-dioxygenase-like lactoylglutathione lyase family enzyme
MYLTTFLALTTMLVRDYDEAIDFFVRAVGFDLVADSPREDGSRWVVVAPPGAQESRLLLARASAPEQLARIGDQTGGRVALFLHTDDFAGDLERMTLAGVHFLESPRHEPYGTVAVFEDLYGNKWDLLEPAAT